LHHGDTKVAQLKVEEWLAAVPPPYPYESVGDINGVTNGTSKSKNFYGKVVELYCLVLLPRNEEWDFAVTFIEMNEYLSDSKKKVNSPSQIRLTSGIYCQIGRPQSRSRKRETKTSSIYHFLHEPNQTLSKSPSSFHPIHNHRRRRSPQSPALPNTSSIPLRHFFQFFCPNPTNLIYISNPSLRPSLSFPPPIPHSTPRLISRRLLPPNTIIRPRPHCRIVKTGRPLKSKVNAPLDGPKSPRNNRYGK